MCLIVLDLWRSVTCAMYHIFFSLLVNFLILIIKKFSWYVYMQPFCLFCASTTEVIGNTMTFGVYCCKYVQYPQLLKWFGSMSVNVLGVIWVLIFCYFSRSGSTLISLSGCYSYCRGLGSMYHDMDTQVNHIPCEW